MIAEAFAVWLLSWVKALVAFATITVPRLIYFILSYSLTLTVRSTLSSSWSPLNRYHALPAQLLVLRDALRALGDRPQLLDTISVSERLRTMEGAAIGQA
jgi:hypothetical protein